MKRNRHGRKLLTLSSETLRALSGGDSIGITMTESCGRFFCPYPTDQCTQTCYCGTDTGSINCSPSFPQSVCPGDFTRI